MVLLFLLITELLREILPIESKLDRLESTYRFLFLFRCSVSLVTKALSSVTITFMENTWVLMRIYPKSETVLFKIFEIFTNILFISRESISILKPKRSRHSGDPEMLPTSILPPLCQPCNKLAWTKSFSQEKYCIYVVPRNIMSYVFQNFSDYFRTKIMSLKNAIASWACTIFVLPYFCITNVYNTSCHSWLR